jgi:hypothetical protein
MTAIMASPSQTSSLKLGCDHERFGARLHVQIEHRDEPDAVFAHLDMPAAVDQRLARMIAPDLRQLQHLTKPLLGIDHGGQV